MKGIFYEAAQSRFFLIDFEYNSNWKWKESAMRQPREDSNIFSIEFKTKVEGIYAGAAHKRF